MTRKLSVSVACETANNCVGRPVKFGQHSWHVFYHEPDETATRTMQADSYTKALAMMVEAKALIAIELLGESWGYVWSDGPDISIYTLVYDGMEWRKAVYLVHTEAISQ